MGLMAMFRRAPEAAETASKSKRAARQQAADHEATVQRLRVQARRRLLGAAVLVGVAVIAFPLVFETQPRPVPMDLPIVIPGRDTAQLGAAPDSRQAREAALPASLPEEAEQQGVEPPPAVARAEPEAPAPVRASAAPAAAPPASSVAASPEPVARFVVQVGAFAERQAAQEARRKLEARGLKTYTQVAKTKDGDRIRVRLGPYAERAEADKAAARAKAAGLAATVLSL